MICNYLDVIKKVTCIPNIFREMTTVNIKYNMKCLSWECLLLIVNLRYYTTLLLMIKTLNLNLACTELCELLTFFFSPLSDLGRLIVLDSVTCNWKQILDLNITVQ